MTSQSDVVEPANAAQPFAQSLANAGIGHVTGQLTEARKEDRLQTHEGGV